MSTTSTLKIFIIPKRQQKSVCSEYANNFMSAHFESQDIIRFVSHRNYRVDLLKEYALGSLTKIVEVVKR